MTDTEMIDFLADKFADVPAFAIEMSMVGSNVVAAINSNGEFPNTQQGLRDLYRQALRAQIEAMASE